MPRCRDRVSGRGGDTGKDILVGAKGGVGDNIGIGVGGSCLVMEVGVG